jgi:hypothetical protein
MHIFLFVPYALPILTPWLDHLITNILDEKYSLWSATLCSCDSLPIVSFNFSSIFSTPSVCHHRMCTGTGICKRDIMKTWKLNLLLSIRHLSCFFINKGPKQLVSESSLWLRMSENRALRVVASRRKKLQEIGRSCSFKSFITCTVRQVQLEWTIKEDEMDRTCSTNGGGKERN